MRTLYYLCNFSASLKLLYKIQFVFKNLILQSHIHIPEDLLFLDTSRNNWFAKILAQIRIVLSRSVVSDSSWPHRLWPASSAVHGILQARKLKWVAIPFSRGSSESGIEPGSPALKAHSLPSEPPVKFLDHREVPLMWIFGVYQNIFFYKWF